MLLHFPTVLLQEDPQHSHSKIFGLVIILLQFHMPQTVGLISLTPYKVHPNVHQQATPPRMVECSVDAAAGCVHLNYDDNRAVGTPPKKKAVAGTLCPSKQPQTVSTSELHTPPS